MRLTFVCFRIERKTDAVNLIDFVSLNCMGQTLSSFSVNHSEVNPSHKGHNDPTDFRLNGSIG